MKKEMFELFLNGIVSDDLNKNTDMYFALYAYETYGDATRDNSFSEMVTLGRELEAAGGDE